MRRIGGLAAHMHRRSCLKGVIVGARAFASDAAATDSRSSAHLGLKGAAALSLAGALAASSTRAAPQGSKPADDRQMSEAHHSSVKPSAAGSGTWGGRWGLGRDDMHVASPVERSPLAEETAPGLWHRLTQPLWLLGGGREAALPPVDVPLPMDKLTCKRDGYREGAYRPVVLLTCGSFNPPTIMHLRMFELAADALRREGYDVLGAYMSPVNDAYAKPGLAPAHHRLRMAELAVVGSALIMVDSWEALQPGYSRTLTVMQRIQHVLGEALSGSQPPPHMQEAGAVSPKLAANAEGATAEPSTAAAAQLPLVPRPRVMMLCGADTVESFASPGLWKEEHLRHILGNEHGVVCIARRGADLKRLLAKPGTLLHEHVHNVMVVEDPVATDISSAKLRQQMSEGRTIQYLTPDAVIDYMRACRVYDSG